LLKSLAFVPSFYRKYQSLTLHRSRLTIAAAKPDLFSGLSSSCGLNENIPVLLTYSN